MSELTQWIQELTQAVSAEAPQIARKYARILTPGWEAIDLQGFILAEPKESFTPFGETPVAFSVIEWFQAASDAGPVMSDLPAEIGGLLSLVTDR